MTTNVPRRALLGAALGAPIALGARSASAETDHDKQMREDFPWLARYAAANATLIATGEPVDIVFMGDSITEGWPDRDPAFFAPPGRVGRGIGGQTTPQMVLRMMADVVALRPKAVHIMAGTNDIAGNTGPMTRAQTEDNLRAMAMIAHAAGIDVLLASIPPAGAFPWRPGLAVTEPIHALNDWIKRYAEGSGATWVDYHPVLATATGAMRAGMAIDGVHPTRQGYRAMDTVLAPLIARYEIESRR